MVTDESRALFSDRLRDFLRPARDAVLAEDARASYLWPTRAQYERACAALGAEPASDAECSPRDFGEDELRAAAVMTLRLERADGIAHELRQERNNLNSRYRDGVDRRTYEALCAQAGVEPAADDDVKALSDEYYAAARRRLLPAIRLELAHLRHTGMLAEMCPPDPWSTTARREPTGLGSVPEIVTTAVVTAALLPFVQAIATKAGEDVYTAVRRVLPRLLPHRKERPQVRTIEIVDPDTHTRLRLDVDLPAEAVERLSDVDPSAVRTNDRLIYWDREQRRWTVR